MTKPAFQRPALAVFIIVVGLWYWYARAHVPSVASVNGIYANPCCSDITLRDGVIISGGDKVAFRLENMKFGLTVYPTARLEVNGTEIVVRPSAEQEALSLDKGGTALSVCGDRLCNRTYVFTRR